MNEWSSQLLMHTRQDALLKRKERDQVIGVRCVQDTEKEKCFSGLFGTWHREVSKRWWGWVLSFFVWYTRAHTAQKTNSDHTKKNIWKCSPLLIYLPLPKRENCLLLFSGAVLISFLLFHRNVVQNRLCTLMFGASLWPLERPIPPSQRVLPRCHFCCSS